MVRGFGILLFFCVSISLIGQNEWDTCRHQQVEKSLEKSFKKARALQNDGNRKAANELYVEILTEFPEYLDANYYYAYGIYANFRSQNFMLTESNHRPVKEAISAFDRIFQYCPHYPKFKYVYYAAQLAYFSEDFIKAKQFASFIIDNEDILNDTAMVSEAKIILNRADFFQRVLHNPVPFDPQAVQGISTEHDEYLACISPDGEQFYFTRRQPYQYAGTFSNITEKREYFCCSHRLSPDVYERGEPLAYPFNLSTNEGSPTINATNDLLIFARMTPVMLGKSRYPNYDLYYSEWINGEWTESMFLDSNINRPDSWESNPSLSADGQTLYFSSDRNGGYGNADIWYSQRIGKNKWSQPVNAGSVINTAGNERSPFLHIDNQTLYFSSSGHPGMGELDIFFSKKNEKGQWTQPVNIGHPINTEYSDVDFFVSLDGKTAYFSSNHLEKGNWNVYQFPLYEKARPKNMLLIKGEISSDNGDVAGAVVELRDTASKIIASTQIQNSSGQYAIATELKTDQPVDIIINVKKEGHAFDTKMISSANMLNNVAISNAEVKKVETGKIYDLHDIYFATNSYELTQKSKQIIDLFVEFLEENPTIKVEIQGHTDNIGNDEANLILSENRAKSVYDYVLQKNIHPNRLKYKGYGENQPIADNDTEAGRAKNRRTVFLIFAK
jgi:outer membrane protein OmpA-like peptidoglycan-associated protein